MSLHQVHHGLFRPWAGTALDNYAQFVMQLPVNEWCPLTEIHQAASVLACTASISEEHLGSLASLNMIEFKTHVRIPLSSCALAPVMPPTKPIPAACPLERFSLLCDVRLPLNVNGPAHLVDLLKRREAVGRDHVFGEPPNNNDDSRENVAAVPCGSVFFLPCQFFSLRGRWGLGEPYPRIIPRTIPPSHTPSHTP